MSDKQKTVTRTQYDSRNLLITHHRSLEPVEQMLADSQGVGDDRQRGIHRRTRYEKARIDDVEIVQVVGLTVDVQHRSLRVVAEPHRAALVRRPRNRDLFAKIEMRRQQVVFAADSVEHAFELGSQSAMS